MIHPLAFNCLSMKINEKHDPWMEVLLFQKAIIRHNKTLPNKQINEKPMFLFTELSTSL